VNRGEFEHVIRAAAEIVNDELVVVGSQAVLGQHRNPPGRLLRSMEVDLYPRSAPGRAVEIDPGIGDGSRFHATFDYYAHGVGPETVIAPVGWQDRRVRVDVPGTMHRRETATAFCLEIHDLVLAKLAAGRPHDIAYAQDAVAGRLVESDRLRELVEQMPDSHRDAARTRLDSLLGSPG
jgi:Nucleotidyltransferase of unknown function (DUF6036)